MESTAAVLSLVLLVSVPANGQPEPVQHEVSLAWAPAHGPSAWWTDRSAGLIGGIAGSTVGILGGVVGTLTGLGKARRLVLGLVVGLVVFGAACLALGIVAVIMSQPYAVYYPPLLMGLICTLVFGINYPVIRRSYAQRELRKMEALDT